MRSNRSSQLAASGRNKNMVIAHFPDAFCCRQEDGSWVVMHMTRNEFGHAVVKDIAQGSSAQRAWHNAMVKVNYRKGAQAAVDDRAKRLEKVAKAMMTEPRLEPARFRSDVYQRGAAALAKVILAHVSEACDHDTNETRMRVLDRIRRQCESVIRANGLP